VSTHQTQSHLHLQQVNTKSTSNSTRGLPALHSDTTLRTYNHLAGSPRMGASSLSHRLRRKLAHKMSAKTTYNHTACPPRNGRFQQSRPMTIQRVPTQPALPTKKTYDHPVCPPHNGLASSPHQQFIASGPFQGQQPLVCVRVTIAEKSGVST
jgi:hypothetical protein